MNNYIKTSFQKLVIDALPKGLYDIIKYVIIALGLYLATLLFPKKISIMDFLLTEFIIKFYAIVLYTIVLLVVVFFILKKYFNVKYNSLLKDNFTDELTGLRNHKALYHYLGKLIEEIGNAKIETLSMVIIDIDNFKQFNTSFGHSRSDLILKKLGELLNSDRRITDETFRQFLRGDEFVVVIKNTNLGDTFKAAERKRIMIENNVFNLNDVFYKLTVSCGVTEFKKNEDTVDTFLNRASQALMTAKSTVTKNNTKSHY